MAALSNPTGVVASMGHTPRTMAVHFVTPVGGVNYNLYLDTIANLGSVSTASYQRKLSFKSATTGDGTVQDAVRVPEGAIPDGWPGAAYVLTALDSGNSNESSGTTAASLEFSR